MESSKDHSTAAEAPAQEEELAVDSKESLDGLLGAWFGFIRWLRGLVFEPAPRAGEETPKRPGIVTRGQRLSDRYSALG